MTLHPGHPVISAGTEAQSDSRENINSALSAVATSTVSDDRELDHTVDGTHVLVDATAAARTISLPDPTADDEAVGVRFVIIKKDSSVNAVTVDTTGSPTINGAASQSLSSQYDSITVFNDGSEWYIET